MIPVADPGLIKYGLTEYGLIKGSIESRRATPDDSGALWSIMEPVIRAGETYTLPRDMPRDHALTFWLSPSHEVFLAQYRGQILGTYFLRANQQGGGAHVANCGYITARHAEGRGIARALCGHCLDHARSRGFLAMQFNFVVSTNTRAVKLWRSLGFEIVGRLPAAFRHPACGLVDAFVMHRVL